MHKCDKLSDNQDEFKFCLEQVTQEHKENISQQKSLLSKKQSSIISTINTCLIDVSDYNHLYTHDKVHNQSN